MFEFDSLSDAQLRQLSPVALAFLGDAVYELYVRHAYLYPPKRIREYHDRTIDRVRAESQAEFLSTIEPELTDAELEIVRRGRNGAGRAPKRLNPQVYKQATGLETLVGYLYLRDRHRLQQLLAKMAIATD